MYVPSYSHIQYMFPKACLLTSAAPLQTLYAKLIDVTPRLRGRERCKLVKPPSLAEHSVWFTQSLTWDAGRLSDLLPCG